MLVFNEKNTLRESGRDFKWASDNVEKYFAVATENNYTYDTLTEQAVYDICLGIVSGAKDSLDTVRRKRAATPKERRFDDFLSGMFSTFTNFCLVLYKQARKYGLQESAAGLMKNIHEEILWKGKWVPTDGHLINIKKSLDAAVKRGSGASADILRGERGLEFYFGVNAKKVLHYFMDMDRDNAVKAIGGLIKYQGRLISDSGDLAALASTLNKQQFMPSDEFVRWVNSD